MPRLALILALIGCSDPTNPDAAPAAEAPVAEPAPVPDSKPTAAAKPATLPPPFSADVIREAMPVGTRIALQANLPSGNQEIVDWEVTGATPETVTIRTTQRTIDGEAKDAPKERTSPWTELESHAIFPAAQTTRTTETITVGAGTFEAWRYDVVIAQGQGINKFWFAPELPGPPVLYLTERQGTEVFRMEMIRRTSP